MKRYKSILKEAQPIHIGKVTVFVHLKIKEEEVSKIIDLFDNIDSDQKIQNFQYLAGNMKLKNLAKFIDNKNIYLLRISEE
jgi:hypothetical protein